MSEVVPDGYPDSEDGHVVAVPIPVAVFEGEYVRLMVGKLPAIVLEMDEGYARGTHLRLAVDVRVRDFDIREGKRGDLTRIHNFALEAVQLVGAYTAEEADLNVGGNSAGGRVEEEETRNDVGF